MGEFFKETKDIIELMTVKINKIEQYHKRGIITDEEARKAILQYVLIAGEEIIKAG